MIKTKKCQIWVSAVLYLLIGSIVIILILQAGLPIIKKSKDMSVFTKTQDTFMSLDNVIVDLIDSGAGSQRVVPFEIHEGKVNLANDRLTWEMESDTKIIEPGTDIVIGNMKITSDIDVDAWDLADTFVLENSHIKVNISKIGNSTNHEDIKTWEIITGFYSKDTDTELGGGVGVFNFTLANKPGTASGQGYTELMPPGNNTDIAFAKVLVHMYSDSGNDYTMELSLDSRADFIAVNILNFK